MKTQDSAGVRLWILGFRALSLLVMVIGVSCALSGVAMLVLSFLPVGADDWPSPAMGVLFAVVGVVFSLIGWRGFKIRRMADVSADLAKTEEHRGRFERWMNR